MARQVRSALGLGVRVALCPFNTEGAGMEGRHMALASATASQYVPGEGHMDCIFMLVASIASSTGILGFSPSKRAHSSQHRPSIEMRSGSSAPANCALMCKLDSTIRARTSHGGGE